MVVTTYCILLTSIIRHNHIPPFRSNKGFDLADDVQKRNVDDMVKAGAEYCVFNCPYCQLGLEEKLDRRGIKPIHMVDLCKMAIGEEPMTKE